MASTANVYKERVIKSLRHLVSLTFFNCTIPRKCILFLSKVQLSLSLVTFHPHYFLSLCYCSLLFTPLLFIFPLSLKPQDTSGQCTFNKYLPSSQLLVSSPQYTSLSPPSRWQLSTTHSEKEQQSIQCFLFTLSFEASVSHGTNTFAEHNTHFSVHLGWRKKLFMWFPVQERKVNSFIETSLILITSQSRYSLSLSLSFNHSALSVSRCTFCKVSFPIRSFKFTFFSTLQYTLVSLPLTSHLSLNCSATLSSIILCTFIFSSLFLARWNDKQPLATVSSLSLSLSVYLPPSSTVKESNNFRERVQTLYIQIHSLIHMKIQLINSDTFLPAIHAIHLS